MVGHGGSSASSYLVDPTSPIPSHCASIVVTSTLRVNIPLSIFFFFFNWALLHHFFLLGVVTPLALCLLGSQDSTEVIKISIKEYRLSVWRQKGISIYLKQ